jgi:hypothetical protein
MVQKKKDPGGVPPAVYLPEFDPSTDQVHNPKVGRRSQGPSQLQDRIILSRISENWELES